MTQTKWIVVFLAGVALGAILAPIRPVPAGAEEQPNIEEMVKNAKTPADHLAVANRYDTLAADAQSKAASHQHMAEAYKGWSSPKGVARSTAMVGHCDTLAKSFDTQAKEYKEMAEVHREMAK